jgi:hypothetical protein
MLQERRQRSERELPASAIVSEATEVKVCLCKSSLRIQHLKILKKIV